MTVRAQSIPLALGLASVGWNVLALWPGAGCPAWPAVTLGALALFLCARRGQRIVLTALAGAMVGFVGMLLGLAQIAVLWALALFTP